MLDDDKEDAEMSGNEDGLGLEGGKDPTDEVGDAAL